MTAEQEQSDRRSPGRERHPNDPKPRRDAPPSQRRPRTDRLRDAVQEAMRRRNRGRRA